jgi:hypothetical protein
MSEGCHITISAPGTIVGATVSAIVYTTLTTTGEIAASATGTGIELAGNVIAYGTELVAGSLAANTVRSFAKTYGAVAKPAIVNTSRLGALGISVLAGTGAAMTTSALVYGGKQAASYIYSYVQDYKKKVASKIQYPVTTEETFEFLDLEEVSKDS